jgi:ribosome-binding factor A
MRLKRISDRIQEELSRMIIEEIQDPRLSGISVTDVSVDRELAYAEIYVSAIEGQERAKEVLEGLKSATGYLRHALAERIDLRVFPRLRFHWDTTPEKADHIERLLSQLRESSPEMTTEDDDEE